MVQPQYVDARPRIRNARSARTATKTRIVRNSRARYTAIARVSVVLGITLVSLLLYVTLTSNMTSGTYALAKAHHEREMLQESTARLDERIAALRSEDHLAAIAAKLGMHEPQQFALVRLGAPRVARAGSLPIVSSIAGWFGNPPQAFAR